MGKDFLPIEKKEFDDMGIADSLAEYYSSEDSGSDMEPDMYEDDDESSLMSEEDAPVWALKCENCSQLINSRGMLVHLVSDEVVTLYSSAESGDVEEKGSEVKFGTCDCKIRKTCCKSCSSEVGYKVTAPCQLCMSQQNNGHYWMYTNVSATVQTIGTHVVTWNTLTSLTRNTSASVLNTSTGNENTSGNDANASRSESKSVDMHTSSTGNNPSVS
eukprot:jgi/Bigna1/66713/fgenesh1_pg.2_\